MHVRALESGNLEGVKAGVHGAALGLAAVMCLYNAAAWLQRRERHLAINAILYVSAIIVERKHVEHHWATLRRLEIAAATVAAAAAAAEMAARDAETPRGDIAPRAA